MKWSLKIAKIAGIDVFIHWTFLILIGWILFSNLSAGRSLAESLWAVVFILVLFACVVLHEFGHALTGKRFGIRTKNIFLLPIGGLANMEKMPEKPIEELWVALAGPAVNVVLALLVYLVLKLSGTMPALTEVESQLSSSNFLFNLFVVNIMLVVFNLIPAFPMDGGRVMRALLAMKFDRAKATEIAAKTGQFLAIVFVFLGLFYNVWLVFIGLFVFLGAGAESKYEATRSVLSKYKVQDVLMKQYTLLQSNETIEKAVEQLLNGQEKEFLVLENQDVIGVLTRDDIIRGLSQLGKAAEIGHIAQKEFLRLSSGTALDVAYEQLAKSGTTISPVFDNGNLIGVLNLENITEIMMIDKVISGS